VFKRNWNTRLQPFWVYPSMLYHWWQVIYVLHLPVLQFHLKFLRRSEACICNG
jgi:hypothetical protein